MTAKEPDPIVIENKTKLSDAVKVHDPKSLKTPFGDEWPQEKRLSQWLREDEPDYAKLPDTPCQETNRYGKKIELINIAEAQSLKINGVEEVGTNPNRNKQHSFFFNADNCIGCHACESACSEKNDLPPHLSFRSVGYVEGGTYPNYQRMNISMACNHCDDPVCLKGCPTRAYTKHPEYGAVIQDPDICFGCGYCTWVCPYNAPQLDPVNGRVEKCNMCVDRLEVGLKPACVSACVGNALDFGVVENIPENRSQCNSHLPGFPDPSITNPNIRFQQARTLPKELTRTDTMPIKYVRDNHDEPLRPVVHHKKGKKQYWGLNKLSSRENPLVIFTVASQTAIGMMTLLTLTGLTATFFGGESILHGSRFYPVFPFIACVLVALGLFMSTVHLGKPMRFYRGFNNWRHSPVAREGLGVVAFLVGTGLHLLISLFIQPDVQVLLGLNFSSQDNGIKMLSLGTATLGMLGGFVGLYYMYRCYRIKARPFWNHWQTATSFVGTALALGSALVIVYQLVIGLTSSIPTPLMTGWILIAAGGIMLEALGLYFHHKDMNSAAHEGAASHYIQLTQFGKTYWLRNSFMAVSFALLLASWASMEFNFQSFAELSLIIGLGLTLVCSLISRALFYVLVIPTTMPGAFFWKNKGFEEHARDIGLANNPAVGVAPLHH